MAYYLPCYIGAFRASGVPFEHLACCHDTKTDGFGSMNGPRVL